MFKTFWQNIYKTTIFANLKSNQRVCEYQNEIFNNFLTINL